MGSQLMIKNSIVLVPFPFDDFSATKVRPALCLTNEIGKFDHVIIAFISSKVSSDISDSEVIIRKNSISAIGTGLHIDSIIKIHKVVTIPKSFIKRRLGAINHNLEAEISAKIKRMFELP